MILGIKQFAVTYGCGTYGSGSYDSNATCTTVTDGGSNNNNGTLPATGQNIIYGLVGGILLIAIAVALFVSSRRKNRK
jgi:LPXTG-motif cell wall-anchored protein